MKELKEYTIQFVGLKEGEHNFDYQIDNKFFSYFDFEEFNASNIKVDLNFLKKTTLFELYFKATGNVNVNCDLTNEPFDLEVSDAFKLVVKFGSDYNNDNEEILIIPHGEYEINVAQYIYELVVLSIPAKRIHPGVEDGTLDSEILKKLEELSPKEQSENETSEEIDPRWNNLKKLLTDK